MSKRLPLRKFFCLLSSLFLVQIIIGQEFIYTHYGVDEGLPSSEVYNIYQDAQGYIWFATDKGLSRYNGYEFKNFTTKDGLPGNTILDFYPQYDGRVFCMEHHSNKLFYFDANFEGFKAYRHNDILQETIPPNAVIKSVQMDSSGALTLGGYGIKGFINISKEGKTANVYDKDIIPEVSYPKRKPHLKLGIINQNNVFSSLHFDYNSDEHLTVIPIDFTLTNRLHVTQLNDSNFVFIDRKLGVASIDKKVTYYENEQNPIGIKRIDDETFWVGYYSNGAEIRNVSGEVIESFLREKSVSGFLIDAEGSYWFTTLDDGVFYIKNPGIKIFSNEHITSLVKDDRLNLFAGHHNGNISRIHKLEKDILYKGLNDRPAHLEFSSAHSTVYGSSDYLMQNFSSKTPPVYIGDVRKLAEEILDPLVNVVSSGFNILVNDSIQYIKTGFRNEDVCLYNDTILIASPSGLYIKKENSIIKHQNASVLKSRLYDIDLNKGTNQVFMASQGNGVIIYGDTIYNISAKNGLTNNIVSEVHIENDSTIWACTNTGLNRIIFNPDKTFTINTITKSDGLLSNDIDDVEIVNDTVWVATKRGLCYFNKSIIDQKADQNILSLSLREVHVNKNKLNEQQVKLKHYQNSIDFKVEAISHRNTKNINYFYRLKEIDSVWTKTTNRVISFPSLSPGNYTFEVKASLFDVPKNFKTSYRFRILPPFWKSWWFYGICILLLSSLVYLFFKIRVLTYNKDVFRELIRLAIKRLKREEQFFIFRESGADYKILTRDILYANSQGNYLDVVTKNKTHTIRCKIGDFINKTPDSLEYLRIHRSYIIRIDQVSSKGKNWVLIRDQKIPVGETYTKELDKIQF